MRQDSSGPKPKDPNYADRVRSSFARQTLMTTISAKMLSVQPGAVEIEIPFCKGLTQQDGFIHAGIVTAIIDTACGYAALSLMPPRSEVLTIEYKANFMAPAVGDRFIARARVIRPGRTITFCAGDVFAVKGTREKVVATMLASMICKAAPASED